MSKGREYTPFLRPMKVPEIDGVYRNKESGSLMMLKNMWLRGFIDAQSNEPYDAYQGTIHHETEGLLKKAVIEPHHLQDGYVKIF